MPPQAGPIPPPRTPRAGSAPPPTAASALSPRGRYRGAALLHPLRAPLAFGSPRRPRALRCRFPPAAPGNPGRLVAEPARAATCRGRRASQRPAAAILHFKAAALFRESTLTCEPYTRNRSAGRHTALELSGPGGAWRVEGEGTRRGARPSGPRGVWEAERSRPRRGPRARLLHAPTPHRSWLSTPRPCSSFGVRPGPLPPGLAHRGRREPPRPSVNRSPAPACGGPAPVNRSPPSPGLGTVPPLASDSSALYLQKPSFHSGLSRRQPPFCQLWPRPPSAPPSYCHCQIVRNAPSHHKPHPLVADLSKPRPLSAEAPPAVNRNLAFPRLVSVLLRSPTSCQLPPRLFLLLVPTPPLVAALPADTKSSVQPHFGPPYKTAALLPRLPKSPPFPLTSRSSGALYLQAEVS